VGRAYDFITFDCYGTLIDWREGIGSAFEEAAARAGRTVSRDRVLAAHAEIEPVVQRGAYIPYAEVLRRTAVEVARSLGWALGEDEARFLPDSLPRWPAFPDVPSALGRLTRSGHRLGILSNVDEDLLAATLPKLGAPFDLVVTAERVRSYKPARAHFDTARAAIGKARWLHAAQSLFHDVEPANRLGIASAWINRAGDRTDGAVRSDLEVPTVAALADLLAS
jgi:2-haloacid dehalogenase/putative hydrolase of the HAD superfamily